MIRRLALILMALACSSELATPTDSDTDDVVDTDTDSDSDSDTDTDTDTDSDTEPPRCPPGSESLVLDLAGTEPTLIVGVPQPASPGFLEGPVWHDGALYLSQIRYSGNPNDADMLRYTPGEGFSVFIEGAGSNGIALDGDGRLVTANHRLTGIAVFDPADADAAPDVLADRFGGEPFNSPNDLALAEDGSVYFTDPDWQCGGCDHQPVEGVYRVAPDGTVSRLDVTQTKPNGIALSPDGKTLYVGGSPTLTAHPVAGDGSIGAGSGFGGVGSTDGLGVDCAGNVYVTTNGQVVVLSPTGEQLGSWSVPRVTNVAFGGEDQRTLYITGFGGNPETGLLREVRLNVPGLPY